MAAGERSGKHPETGKDLPAKTAPGLSAFITRVLEQLSLSAWLPAAMLMGSLTVLIQLHSQPNRNMTQALRALRDKPVGVLLLVLFGLVLTTIITQAFEFEVIRLLEGYWGAGWAIRPLSAACTAVQRRRRDRIRDHAEAVQLKAYRSSGFAARLSTRKKYIADILESELGGPPTSAATGWLGWWRRLRARRQSSRWEVDAPPDVMRRRDALVAEFNSYPIQENRILPTRLGNILRAGEEQLPLNLGEKLEGYVIRRWDSMSDALRREHDQYRTRLDLYCTLVFVFLVLATVSPPLLTRGKTYAVPTILTAVAYLVLSAVSYGAALVSARAYVLVLAAIPQVDDPPARSRWRRQRGKH